MEELSSIIADLLKKYNRVSLPGIGAFLATPAPAVIDKDTKMVYPPSKSLSFSKAEVWNDGLLEARYAEKHQVEAQAARETIKDLMMGVQFELDEKGKFVFQGLGVLRQSPSRKLTFEQNKNTNLESESFGLAPTNLVTTSSTMARLSGIPKTSLVIFVGMILAVVFIGLYLALSSPQSADDLVKVLDFEDKEHLMLQPGEEEDMPGEMAVDPVEAAGQPVASTKPAATTTANSTPAPAAAPSTTAGIKPAPPTRAVIKTEYFVIVSSFNTREAAEMCVSNYKKMGYKGARWLDAENGRYRVSAATCPTYAEAKKVAKQLESIVKDAWVYELKQ